MRVLLFDLDGVVCRNGYFTEQLAEVHGIPLSRWGDFFTRVMPECVEGRRDLRRELEPILPQVGWTKSVDSLLEFWFAAESPLCVSLMRVVSDLRRAGTKCYLATNQERNRLAYIREVMGLAELMDGIFVSCELCAAKPSPEFFSKVQMRLGAAEVCLIDDSPANVRAAQAFGWHALHYRGAQDLPLVLAAANKSLQPTPTAVTPPAAQEIMPAVGVAEH